MDIEIGMRIKTKQESPGELIIQRDPYELRITENDTQSKYRVQILFEGREICPFEKSKKQIRKTQGLTDSDIKKDWWRDLERFARRKKRQDGLLLYGLFFDAFTYVTKFGLEPHSDEFTRAWLLGVAMKSHLEKILNGGPS